MAPGPELRLASEVASRIGVAAVAAQPVEVRASGSDLLKEIDRCRAALAERYTGRSPSEIDGLAPARELYRDFRIDPTRTRPSSEALFRRVLLGKPLPVILNAVDVCTLLSLEFLLPLGLYDTGKITGGVTLRRGRPGESYAGIRKDEVHLEGRPVLADEAGPFGNPTSDSLRTCVTESTRALWLVVFAPAATPRANLSSHAARAAQCMARHLGTGGGEMTTEAILLP